MTSRVVVVALIAALVALVAVFANSGRGNPLRAFPAHITVLPQPALVFRGERLQLRTRAIGSTNDFTFRWSLVGPGSVDDSGLYRAGDVAPATTVVVASLGMGYAGSATVRTVAPPSRGTPLVLVSCYEDGTVNVNDARNNSPLGAFTVGGRAAGITVDPAAQRAIFAVDSQLVAVDLPTMRWQTSAPVNGTRFSEVALLAWGYVAATDNLAEPGHPGVRVFRINRSGVPILVSSVAAGETPEGISATDGGRTFYVANINSNSVMRFALDAHGRARLTGSAHTATRPFGVAVDPVHHLLFVVDNDTATLNGSRANPGLELFSLPSMRRVGDIRSTGSKASLPLGVAVDSSLSRLFVSNEGEANVAVFSIPTMRRIATLQVGLTPWLPYFDRLGHRLYVPSARRDALWIFDTVTLRAIARDVPTCSYPTSVAVFNSARRAH